MKKASPYLETKRLSSLMKSIMGKTGICSSTTTTSVVRSASSQSPHPEVLIKGAEKSQARCYLADLMRLQFADNWGLSLMMK